MVIASYTSKIVVSFICNTNRHPILVDAILGLFYRIYVFCRPIGSGYVFWWFS